VLQRRHVARVYGCGGRYAVGARAAYDAGPSSYRFGITPPISRGFRLTPTTGWFAEADVPDRRNRPAGGAPFTSVALAGHLGVPFPLLMMSRLVPRPEALA
jgi:hypothetical protein